MSDSEPAGRPVGPPSSSPNFRTYLAELGVPELPPLLVPFDPGLAPAVLQSHLAQSAHLMLGLKVSMACWLIADEAATREKVTAAKRLGVAAHTGGGPYEVALAQGRLDAYLDLCADIGFSSIECGAGFTDPRITPEHVVAAAASRGLGVEYELGKKHGGQFTSDALDGVIEEGHRWLAAGASRLVIEARESASEVGLFDRAGQFDAGIAEALVDAFGHGQLVFEAPTKSSQFALLDHFGPQIRLSNVPLDEVLRVEIYRRGLHSDAFANPKLRPQPPA